MVFIKWIGLILEIILEPAISAIMPVYNTEEIYLRHSIKTILEQTFGNFELIIVNDGSTNNAEDVILSIKDDRIKYLRQDNAGQSSARNTALKIAKGKYIFFIDADDWVQPKTFELAYNLAEKNNLEILNFGVYTYDHKYKSKNIWKHDVHMFSSNTLYNNKSPEVVKDFFKISQTCWGKLFKREFLIKNNLFFVEGLIFEDLEYIPRCLVKVERMMFEPVFLYIYRLNVSNSTMKSGNKKFFNIIKIFNSIETTIKENNLYEKVRVKFYDYKVSAFTRLNNDINPEYKEEFIKMLKDDLKNADVTKQEIFEFFTYCPYIAGIILNTEHQKQELK